jgi:2-phospho-L-lactate guanylyltransferase
VSGVWAAVAFRGLSAPKRRLAPLLRPAQRRQLAQAMLNDVLTALDDARGIERLVVVTRDANVYYGVEPLGVVSLYDTGRSYRAAAAQAAEAAREGGAEGLLMLPGDLPLLTAAEVETLLEMSSEVPVTLVPSRSGDGTNALLTRPPGVIRYRYGRSSYHRHLEEASALGLATVTVRLEGISVDIDEPADLLWLAQRFQPSRTQTWLFLADSGLLDWATKQELLVAQDEAAERTARPRGLVNGRIAQRDQRLGDDAVR